MNKKQISRILELAGQKAVKENYDSNEDDAMLYKRHEIADESPIMMDVAQVQMDTKKSAETVKQVNDFLEKIKKSYELMPNLSDAQKSQYQFILKQQVQMQELQDEIETRLERIQKKLNI